MRNRSICLVIFSVFVWGVLTYFLFLDRPDGKKDQQALTNQIETLRRQVQQRIVENQILLKRLTDQQRQRLTEGAQSTAKVESVPSTIDEGSVVPAEIPKTEEELRLEKLQHLASKKTLSDGSPIIAVLVFSCNRVTVKKCLDQLIKLRPNTSTIQQFPIIASQDCGHQATSDIIESYGDQVVHIRQPDLSDIDIPLREKKFKGYFKIARHYGWALNQVFLVMGFQTVIIVEDDLDVAPDFFEYFLGTYPILVADKSLWCVSAWNDNGKSAFVDPNGAHLLYRTDFFPGLGWMLTKDLWEELSPKWPKAYWDDWIRRPEQRKDRACIRPELSRTRTFGKVGVSNGLFYEKHLKFIKLNEKRVPFTKMNLTYLLKNNYDVNFINEINQSPIVALSDLRKGVVKGPGPVRLIYTNRDEYKIATKALGLMDDFRSGVPRTSYRGVVTFFYKNTRVHLTQNTTFNGYDITWS